MPTKLPLVPSVGFYDFSTTLDGLSLTFTIRWNQRDEAYYMDIATQAGSTVISGLKIVLGVYLGRASLYQLFQDGVLVAIDTSGEGRDAGFDDLGGRVEMWYYTANELVSSALGRP